VEPAKQLRLNSPIGASRFGEEAQEIHGFHGFADSHQAMRAAAREVLAEIQRALLRERAQQEQLVDFL
jgi:hypothetical protein